MIRTRNLLSLILLTAVVSAQSAVTVVSTSPANGAKDVDPSITEFKVRFSEAVRTDGCSFVNTQHGKPLNVAGKPVFSEQGLGCTLRIELEPNTRYSVSINSDKFTNFRSARDPNVAVTPHLVVFTTGSGRARPGTTLLPSKSAPVIVLRTFPENDAKAVDPQTEFIRVRFSRAVSSKDYAFVESDKGEKIVPAGEPRFEDGNTLCILPVKLQPGTTYAVGINSYKIGGLRSSEDPDVAVTPYLLSFTTSGTAPKKAGGITPQQWREDLAFLAAELPKRHKNLFFKLTEDQWKQKVKALDDAIPNLTEAGVLAGLLELTASIGDQHTGIGNYGSKSLTPLPVACHWFSDGIFVVGAAEEYRDVVGCRVEKIGNIAVEEACDKLTKLFVSESESSKRNMAPQFLMVPQFLKALGIIPSDEVVSVSLRDAKGKVNPVEVRPAESPASVKFVRALDDSQAVPPISVKNPGLPYWAEYVEYGDMVYFQYNQCADSPNKPFAEMRSELEKLLGEHKDARLVVDLRQNGGGNSMILDPFIAWLKGNKDLNRKGRLFVIVGRRTFSSAILNAASLRKDTESILVGETTGASANHYGEVKTFDLPNSRLMVTYSTKYFRLSETDGPIVPDIPAELSFRDYMKGIDPALEAIVVDKHEGASQRSDGE